MGKHWARAQRWVIAALFACNGTGIAVTHLGSTNNSSEGPLWLLDCSIKVVKLFLEQEASQTLRYYLCDSCVPSKLFQGSREVQRHHDVSLNEGCKFDMLLIFLWLQTLQTCEWPLRCISMGDLVGSVPSVEAWARWAVPKASLTKMSAFLPSCRARRLEHHQVSQSVPNHITS